MIKAAIAVGGGAVSVYEQVYPMKRYNSPKTHREFLFALKSILPDGCRPILVTDKSDSTKVHFVRRNCYYLPRG